MPISLVLRDEDGESIRWADVTYRQSSVSLDRARFPLLRGVDPYGDTIFNCFQMRMLFDELDLLLDEELSPEERASAEAVWELCREGQRSPHRYLWFVGD